MSDTNLTHDGITQPITEWALDYGIYPSVITDRLARGWSVERAITTPMIALPDQKLCPDHMPKLPRVRRTQSTNRRFQFDGLTLTIPQWSQRVGIAAHVLRTRIRKGMEIGEALTRPVRTTGPGVGKNFQELTGTGAGCATQDFPKIEISQ